VLAIRKGTIQTGIDPGAVATVIVSTLEGALMISRLEKNGEALHNAKLHLNRYLDSLAR
jgi:hypothetical protein